MFGGLFLEMQSGGVFWLDCPAGTLERVADSADEFNAYIESERTSEWLKQIEWWFLGPLVEKLRDAGKRPLPGQCYGLLQLPIFVDGLYSIENVYVLPVREWLTLTGSLHEQICDLPDGAKVRFEIVP